jgi:putative photosynthetic complex assembly protein 2
MDALIIPMGIALLVWWFSTGAVLWLGRLPRATHGLSLSAGAFLAVMALVGLIRSAQGHSAASAYCGFVTAVLVWAWFELGFLTGVVTGSRRSGCLPGSNWRVRFKGATLAIWHHELALVAVLLVLAWTTWGAPTPTGLWTFALLWVMRLSSKLNLFWGVRNTNEHWLPAHLSYMGSYFRRAQLNPLFPVSVSLATVAIGWLGVMAVEAAPHDEALATHYALLTALLSLAVLEHWLLVLPFDASVLWRWAFKNDGSRAARVR